MSKNLNLPKIRLPSPSWKQAKCASPQPDDIFFSQDADDQEEAKAFCNGIYDNRVCPVRNECLIFALANKEHYGVWGGEDPLTRKAQRAKLNPGRAVIHPAWVWETQEQALQGFTQKEIDKMRESLLDNQDN